MRRRVCRRLSEVHAWEENKKPPADVACSSHELRSTSSRSQNPTRFIDANIDDVSSYYTVPMIVNQVSLIQSGEKIYQY
jgi:hypothetical protein